MIEQKHLKKQMLFVCVFPFSLQQSLPRRIMALLQKTKHIQKKRERL